MLQDPSEILNRVPELESLAGEPSIRRAIEAGDPFKIYRALFWTRRGRSTASARPCSGSPSETRMAHTSRRTRW